MAEVLRIGDLADVTMGLSPSGDTYNEDGEGLPLLNGPTEFGPRSPRATLYTTDPKRVCDVGDLIFCVRGNTTGKWNIADRRYALGRGVAGIRGHLPTDTDFVAYSLEVGLPRLLGLAGGSTMPNLRKGDIEGFEILVPPQRATVVDVVSAVDDLVEKNRRRIEILEEMARLIYREWFVHLRFPGHQDVGLVDSELGPIPEGWDVVTLSEVVSTQYGYTESAKDEPVGPRYLRGMDMNKTSYINWSTVPFCPISAKDRTKFKVDVGDIFVIRMADPGKVSICEQEVDAVFASYLVRLKPTSERLTPYFLFYTLNDDRYQGWVTGASTGATRKSVSAKVMTEPSIVLAPGDLQEQFVATVAPIRALLTNLLEQNGVLASARDLLLPRLISGELDVSDLDMDLEPVV